MQAGGASSPCTPGIVQPVAFKMRSIGCAAQAAARKDLMEPGKNLFGPLPDREFCEKCQRYYNPKSPHICFPDDMDVITERRKLVRWLGEGFKILE